MLTMKLIIINDATNLDSKDVDSEANTDYKSDAYNQQYNKLTIGNHL